MCTLERVNQGFLYLKVGVALARRITISNVDRRDPPILPAMKRREASHACTRLPVQLMPADVTQGGSEGRNRLASSRASDVSRILTTHRILGASKQANSARNCERCQCDRPNSALL